MCGLSQGSGYVVLHAGRLNANRVDQGPWEMVLHQKFSLFSFLDSRSGPMIRLDRIPIYLI